MDVNLVLHKQNGSKKTFHIPSTVTVIGRRQECDLCIPLMIISRRHCQLNFDENTVHIRDLGSRNGTFVNGRKIEETELSPGDMLEVGPLKFTVQINGEPAVVETPSSQQDQQKQAKTAEHANEFASEQHSEQDPNSTYSSTEILNGINEESNSH